MTNNEIRNTLGVYDNDVLNAACECERKEDLAEKIAEKIVKSHGYDRGLYNGNIFKFALVKKVLKSFGFNYVSSNEETEEHLFVNNETKDEVSIFPVTFYPEQDAMRFANFLLS